MINKNQRYCVDVEWDFVRLDDLDGVTWVDHDFEYSFHRLESAAYKEFQRQCRNRPYAFIELRDMLIKKVLEQRSPSTEHTNKIKQALKM